MKHVFQNVRANIFFFAKLHCVCPPNTCCEINNDVLLHNISASFSQRSPKHVQLKTPLYSLVFPLNQEENVHIRGNHHC